MGSKPRSNNEPSAEPKAEPPAEQPVQSGTVQVVGARDVSADLADTFEGFAGSGMESVSAQDVLIPRLTILQALSPQLKKSNAAFIAGAGEGDLCDASLNEIIAAPVHFIPVKWSKSWLEWAPRNSGKGLVGVHDSSILQKTVPDKDGKPTYNGNLIAETAQWYGLNLSSGRRQSFIPMSSTNIKRSRRWMTLAMGEKLINSSGGEYTPPLFYRSYFLTSVLETKGDQTWFTWHVERGPALPELPDYKNLFSACVEMRDRLDAATMSANLAAANEDPNIVDVQAEVNGNERRM